jgi:hypothetical protein
MICPLANLDSLHLSGRPVVSPGSTKRVAPIVRPTTPKSTVPTVAAFDIIDDSYDEDIIPDAKNDAAYLSSNSAIVSPSCLCPLLQLVASCNLFPLVVAKLSGNGMNSCKC